MFLPAKSSDRRDAGVGERHLQRARALEDLGDVDDVGALLASLQRLGHPGDGEVGLAVGEHLLRHDVDAALDDLDVEAAVLVEALVDRREVAAELGLGDPLQLQRHRRRSLSHSPPAAVPSGAVVARRLGACRRLRRLGALPGPSVRRAGAAVPAVGVVGRASSSSSSPHAAATSASASTPALAILSRFLMWWSSPGADAPVMCGDALQADGDQVEHQPEQAGAEHVGPGRSGVRGHVRGDAGAEAVLRAAEVLGDEGGDDGRRGGDLQRLEQVRHGVRDARLGEHLRRRGGVRAQQLEVRRPRPGAGPWPR